MSTKVGEGYIEIKPKLTGFDSTLIADARARLKKLSDASVIIKPKIQGITKVWQSGVQAQINREVTGLTVNVHVKINTSQLAAGLKNVTVQAQSMSSSVAGSTDKMVNKLVDNTKRAVREAEIAIKTGTSNFDDKKVTDATKKADNAYRILSNNITKYSNSQVGAIRSAVNEHKTLGNTVEREAAKVAAARNKIIAGIESELRASDKLYLATRKLMKDNVSSSNQRWGFVNSLDRNLMSATKTAENWGKKFTQLLDDAGSEGGSSFGSGIMSAVSTTARFMVARFAVAIPLALGAIGYAITPVVNGIVQLAGGITALASSGFYAAGSLAALPAVFAAVGQGAGVLGIAFNGITDALTALQNQAQHQKLTDQTMARSQRDASKQMANAKQALEDAVRSANRNIAGAEDALAKAQENASQRISDSIQKLADIKEVASKRITDADQKLMDVLASTAVADAQDRLAQSIIDANSRIADSQRRLSDVTDQASRRIITGEAALASAHLRTAQAMGRLNDARAVALDQLRDLAIAEARSFLDEEAAKNAISDAEKALATANLNPNATADDKRDADLAVRQALQNLAEIKARNQDLREEIDAANHDGIEGSKAVVDAKQAILDAQQAEIDAEKELAQTRLDAARDILDAENDIAKVRADNTAQIADAEKNVSDARIKLSKDIAGAEKDLADARKEASRDIADAEKNIADERVQAAENIKQAEASLAQARLDGARNLARAHQDISDASDNVAYSMEKVNAQAVNAQFAMSLLSPEAQKFVQYLNDTFIPKMYDVQFAIQDAFFPPIQKAMEKSGGLIDLLKEKLTTTAGIFGEFGARILEFLNTDESKNILGHIMDTNNRLFEKLGPAGEHFAHALLIITDAAGPFLDDMVGLVDKFAEWIDKAVSSKAGRKELADFFDRVSTTVKTVFDILGPFGEAIYKIFKLGQPAGQDLLTIIAKTAKKFLDWVDSTEGKNQLKVWFEKGKAVMEQLLGLVEDIVAWFWLIGNSIDFAAIIQTIRDDLLPAFASFAGALGGDGGGGIIFLIKAAAVGLNLLSLAVLYASLSINLFTGDSDGLRKDLIAIWDVSAQTARIFGQEIPEQFATGQKTFDQFAQQFGVSADGVGDSAGGMKDSVHYHMDEFGRATKNTAKEVADELALRAKGGATSWTTGTKDMGTDVGKNLTGMKDDAKTKTKQMAEDMKARMEGAGIGVTGATADMSKMTSNEIEQMKRDAAGKFDGIRDQGVSAADQLRSGVATQVGGAKNSINTTLNQAEQDTRNRKITWGRLADDIIGGLMTGLLGWQWKVLQFFGDLGVNMLKTFKEAISSNSPSKKFMAAGMTIGQGAAIGIEQSSALAITATQDMARGVASAWDGLRPDLDVNVGSMGGKLVPPPGLNGTSLPGSGRQYNITMIAAPSVPTERQISSALNYADSLYGRD